MRFATDDAAKVLAMGASLMQDAIKQIGSEGIVTTVQVVRTQHSGPARCQCEARRRNVGDRRDLPRSIRAYGRMPQVMRMAAIPAFADLSWQHRVPANHRRRRHNADAWRRGLFRSAKR
ncbi:MAG: hypothetical protein R3D70_10590 [Rhizobiaceae bacterium]